jgi:hypothetical protein
MTSVTLFGAIGDSIHDDSAALQRALDADESHLYIPAGKYRIHGMLTLRSHTTLTLHPEAYMLLDDHTGSDQTPYLLTCEPDATDITVDGGVWEGNCEQNPRDPGEHPYRGILLSFSDATHLTLRNMTLRNSEAFHIRLNYVTDFLIEHITFDDTIIRFTQDGIHLGGGCERGIIRHIHAVGASSPNDDLISLCADYVGENMAPTDPIWGQRPGPIRDIEMYDVTADNTFSFLRIFSHREPIERVYAHHFSGGCYYLALQMEITPYLRNRFEDYPPETVYGTGQIRDIRIEDWRVHMKLPYGTHKGDYFINHVGGVIDIEQSITGLSIRRFERDLSRDAKPDRLPTLTLRNFKVNHIALSPDEAAAHITPGYTPYTLSGSIPYLDLTTNM